jgi:peptidoglycan hydrolase-like protein with peptidoglycan-binding domain
MTSARGTTVGQSLSGTGVASDAGSVEAADSAGPAGGALCRRPRRRLLAGVVGVLLAGAGAIALLVGDPFAGGDKPTPAVSDNASGTSLARVTRGMLSSQTSVSGTLGYAGSYSIINARQGTFTALPHAGQIVGCGRVLYRVANSPVVLLCGRTPMYRSLSQGDSGPDVRQLNANLVRLGYATRSTLDPSADYFGSETRYALERLQKRLGVDQTESLELGRAVFLPGPLRITKVIAMLGTSAGPGGAVAQATSTRRQVQVALDAAQQSSVEAGDRVSITLPDNRTTPGAVTSVGTVASSRRSSGATIPVYISPREPRATGSLDQAPVQVQITTASVRDALMVPVDALLARAGGGYAVETVDAVGAHHVVAVTPGLFDDADGLVQVSGSLSAGEHVVVPSA